MIYRIALNFQDNTTRFIDCRAGETVLAAANRSKINLPMDCLNGFCGTCKCQCEHGNYDLGNSYLDDALSSTEAAKGGVLTCQMIPSSDCLIRVPVSSSACMTAPIERQCIISEIRLLAETTISLKLKMNDPQPLEFLPGQYVNIRLPGTNERRAFSFSSGPGEIEVSFLIRNLPGGMMSQWLTSKALPGMSMSIEGPKGAFFLHPVQRPVLMLAGGTGIAPFLSMLQTLQGRETKHSIHLIYGVAKESEMVAVACLEALAKRIPTFTWSVTVSDPETAWPYKGYVTEHISDENLNAGDVDIYLCGPPPMVEAVRVFLDGGGIQPRNFYYEKFISSEGAADAGKAIDTSMNTSMIHRALEFVRRLFSRH
ncbi:benzoate 1,2-dioxygenase electron transfer component BenC [Raoultella terrigena]|uniref:benzoate 1,2-dioxygenase electron transfer component BenC n=1 Tax=Raoultella terrigena TaxID=577 RepID=UPI001F51A83F|nr:benzoate 1,2-dioxygenase electron transfer component BenC [Raoultella terrigena]MCI1034747.1 ring-hydroxylating dioxygenase ferredoxin reductase family protein [Raoultella terrigena]